MHRADGTIIAMHQATVLPRLTTVCSGTAHHAGTTHILQGRPLIQGPLGV
jgi:hypothetical protein